MTDNSFIGLKSKSRHNKSKSFAKSIKQHIEYFHHIFPSAILLVVKSIGHEHYDVDFHFVLQIA